MPRYAAIDIGSNSVRMMAAELQAGAPFQVLASERSITRLGESVFRSGRISPEALEFVCAQLRKMTEMYRALDVAGVRVVATSAVRDASNRQEFMDRASEAVQAPVEIISGLEEARLIHLGVQTRWPQPDERILIIDVGGGSAEMIAGDHGELEAAVSKPLGAVRLREVFLQNDPPSPKELRRMEQFIDERIDNESGRFGGRPYDRVIGTSATAAALVCAANDVPRAKRDEADRMRAALPQIRKVYKELSKRSLEERRKIPGIGPRRAEIILPGAAVFLHVLSHFELPALHYSVAGVRDGIIADLAARGVGAEFTRLEPTQRRVVEEMARKYKVPLQYARRVAFLGHQLFKGLQSVHRLPPTAGRLLEAAAYLHNIGHFISDVGHHKHSHYVVSNSDMPGFEASERQLIAVLCRHHRKSIPSARHEAFQALPPEGKNAVMMLIPLLRLASALDHRHEQHVESVEVHLRENGVLLAMQADDDADMEQWAAERVRGAFEAIYGRPLMVARARNWET